MFVSPVQQKVQVPGESNENSTLGIRRPLFDVCIFVSVSCSHRQLCWRGAPIDRYLCDMHHPVIIFDGWQSGTSKWTLPSSLFEYLCYSDSRIMHFTKNTVLYKYFTFKGEYLIVCLLLTCSDLHIILCRKLKVVYFHKY